MPIMPFFVRDYIAATRHMSLEQRGAYTDLLFFQWDMGALPSDPAELARMLGASVEQFSSIWPSIADKFVTHSGTLKNLRVEIERKNAKKIKKSHQQKAKNAAKSRWDKVKSSNASSMRQAVLEECPPSASPSYSEIQNAEPPSAAAVPDPKKALFDLGVSLLGENRRSLIGKAVASVGLPKVGEVLAYLAENTVADPASYFAKATQHREERVERFKTA